MSLQPGSRASPKGHDSSGTEVEILKGGENSRAVPNTRSRWSRLDTYIACFGIEKVQFYATVAYDNPKQHKSHSCAVDTSSTLVRSSPPPPPPSELWNKKQVGCEAHPGVEKGKSVNSPRQARSCPGRRAAPPRTPAIPAFTVRFARRAKVSYQARGMGWNGMGWGGMGWGGWLNENERQTSESDTSAQDQMRRPWTKASLTR